jgi:hypothetical protein
MATGSAIPGVKSYLVDTLLPTLFPAAQVIYGPPGGWLGEQVISVGNATVESSQMILGANRPRREDAEVEVILSVFQGGGPEAQQTATEAAFAMLGTFADHFRTQGNETLGGACDNAYVSAYSLDETDDPDVLEKGRYAALVATLTVQTFRLL